MKLNLFNRALFALVAVGSLASCQNEIDAPGPKGGEREVTFTTQLPVGFTRAFADGNTADVLTCYVYDSTGENLITQAKGSVSGGSGQVVVQLAGNENYKILFWAANSQVFDAEQPQSATMPYKLNPANGELSVDYALVNGNHDKYDAFYNVISLTGGETTSKNVDLKRAFAQVNVGTDDSELQVVKEAYKDVFTSYAKICTEAAIYGVCNRVNLVQNTAEAADTTTFKVKREEMSKPAMGAFFNESFPVVSNPAYKYTSMAYVLASPTGSTVNVGFKAFNSATQPESEFFGPIQTLMIPNAPLKTNWRTNIYGSLLSSKSNFEVKIEPNIQGTEKDVIVANNIEQLSSGISSALTKNESAKVSLKADMADQVLTIPATTAPTTIDIETNGKAIPAIVAAENVTINIYENFPSPSPSAKARRTRSAQALFTAVANSTINIYGGSYESDNMFATEGNGAIHVYGGNFKGVTKATLEGYVAEGKYVVNGENGFLTITSTQPEHVVTVTTKQEFIDAIAEANATPDTRIVVSENITFTDVDYPIGDKATFTGTGTILEISAGKYLNYDMVDTYSHKEYFIIVNPGADLTLKGPGTFKGRHRLAKVFGTLNFDGAKVDSNSGSLTTRFWIENDGIVNVLEGTYIDGQERIFVLSGSTFNMSGGTIIGKSNNEYCIMACEWDAGEEFDYSKNSVNISGGTITSAKGALHIDIGTLNITGNPKFNLIEPNTDSGSYCIYVGNDWEGMDPETLFDLKGEISGGEFNGSTFYSINAQKTKVQFKGGKYISNNEAPAIFSGYYFNNIDGILAPGYKWETNFGDPVYTHRIVPAEPAAKRRR